ncbi:MAG: ribosomal L7Ae/L30e/S12e/Gadd45 family protein [Clostridia bacterium]|nr:ribosomal L7Ae/L30e/S12e/Gadd45 family protein [Clostridia bacterium]
MNNKLCGLLGIARRAGHLIIGFDAVRAALLSHKAQLILLAGDCSPKTEKELRYAGQNNACPLLKADAAKDELAAALGLQKPVAVVATTDPGFAKSFANAIKLDGTHTKEDVAL